MRIEFDYDFGPDDVVVATHFIDTDDPLPMKVIKALASGSQKIQYTGWDVVTKHPSYVGQTRFQVVMAEIKRLGVTL